MGSRSFSWKTSPCSELRRCFQKVPVTVMLTACPQQGLSYHLRGEEQFWFLRPVFTSSLDGSSGLLSLFMHFPMRRPPESLCPQDRRLWRSPCLDVSAAGATNVVLCARSATCRVSPCCETKKALPAVDQRTAGRGWKFPYKQGLVWPRLDVCVYLQLRFQVLLSRATVEG